MKPLQQFFLLLFFAPLFLVSCKNKTGKAKEREDIDQKEENVTFSTDSVTMKGYVVYDDNIEGKRPAIIVVPEWRGLNDYAKVRAKQLAELCYSAMPVDMHGIGKQAKMH